MTAHSAAAARRCRAAQRNTGDRADGRERPRGTSRSYHGRSRPLAQPAAPSRGRARRRARRAPQACRRRCRASAAARRWSAIRGSASTRLARIAGRRSLSATVQGPPRPQAQAAKGSAAGARRRRKTPVRSRGQPGRPAVVSRAPPTASISGTSFGRVRTLKSPSPSRRAATDSHSSERPLPGLPARHQPRGGDHEGGQRRQRCPRQADVPRDDCRGGAVARTAPITSASWPTSTATTRSVPPDSRPGSPSSASETAGLALVGPWPAMRSPSSPYTLILALPVQPSRRSGRREHVDRDRDRDRARGPSSI